MKPSFHPVDELPAHGNGGNRRAEDGGDIAYGNDAAYWHDEYEKLLRAVDVIRDAADMLAELVDGETRARSRYAELFGTPERAARTLEEFELDQINWCRGIDGCEKCPYEFDRYGCYLSEAFSLIEWLRGDAE